MKISHKIGVFSVFVALVPMMIVGISGYVKGIGLLNENQIKIAEQAVVRAEDQIVKKIDEAKSIATILAENIGVYGIEKGFRSFSAAASLYEDYQWVYFGAEETGNYYISPFDEMPPDYDPRKRPWYGIAKDKKAVVSEPYVDATSGEVIVTISRAAFRDGKKIGVVGVDLDFSAISRQIMDIQIGRTGYIFVLYKDGTTLIHKKKDLIGKNLTGKMDFLKKMLELKNGLLQYNFKGEKFSVVRTLDEYGWTIGGGTYYSEIREPMKALRNFILIALTTTLLLVLVGIFLMNRSITTPLNHISLNMKDIAEGEGDLTRRLEVMSKDEVGGLAESFNLFTEKLKAIITDIAGNAARLDSSSGDLLSISRGMNEGTTEMSSKSRTVAGAAEKMSANMTSVAAAAEQSSSNITMVSAAAEEMTQPSPKSHKTLRKNAKQAIRRSPAQRRHLKMSTASADPPTISERWSKPSTKFRSRPTSLR